MKRILNLAIALVSFISACTGDEEAGISTNDWLSVAPTAGPLDTLNSSRLEYVDC
jgi:hypothetical protein